MTCIHNNRTTSRFWSKVRKDAPNKCWIWDACINNYGYGLLAIGGSARRARTAHRFSWEINVGRIPDGMCVLHKCDTPACVNPDHLFIGTHAENMADMAAKGRGSKLKKKGVDHSQARLTEQDVYRIREQRLYGAKLREIAEIFGVSLSQIGFICQRKKWDHI